MNVEVLVRNHAYFIYCLIVSIYVVIYVMM